MKKLKVTVNGKVYEVTVESVDSPEPSVAEAPTPVASSPVTPPSAVGASDVPSPLAGKVVEVKVSVGDTVAEGDTLLILEAMKMNTLVTAPVAGTVQAITVGAGDAVEEGQTLVSF